jgi:hypothetical protein
VFGTFAAVVWWRPPSRKALRRDKPSRKALRRGKAKQ